MKAEIVLLNPELAKRLLKKNVGNRDLKNRCYNSYINQMKNGSWKENGEPIIIDKNGIIKDGQHRLMAVIEANYSYHCPIISDVDPNVMDTIDTGTNRSLPDVLKLNGFIYNIEISSLIKSINKYQLKLKDLGDSGHDRLNVITNSMGLDYALKNKEPLIRLCSESKRIHSSQKVKLLNIKQIGTFLYIIAKGFDFNQSHIDFIELICGVKADSNSCTKYVYDKILASKTGKINIKSIYLTNLIIKGWNIYNSCDMPVNRINVRINNYEKVM